MARIRTVKPEFWTSEQVVCVERDARLLFIGLLNFADDVGNGRASSTFLKMSIFPGDDDMTRQKIDSLMSSLDAARLIRLYAVAGEAYYSVCNFLKHQVISHAKPAKYPPPGAEVLERSSTIPVMIQDHSVMIGRELIGVDGNGIDGNAAAALPFDVLTDEPEPLTFAEAAEEARKLVASVATDPKGPRPLDWKQLGTELSHQRQMLTSISWPFLQKRTLVDPLQAAADAINRAAWADKIDTISAMQAVVKTYFETDWVAKGGYDVSPFLKDPGRFIILAKGGKK